MTSYQVQAHVDRTIHPSYTADPKCVFCRIVGGTEKAYIVWEDEHTIAFLDLMPIRRGHTLLIPKTHCPRISDLDPEIGAKLGAAIPLVTRAITKALGNPDLNVVLNQGYAQAVFHAHFHLIPAPHPSHPPKAAKAHTGKPTSKRVSDWTAAELQANPPSHQEMLRGETAARSGFLGEREGGEVGGLIRAAL